MHPVANLHKHTDLDDSMELGRVALKVFCQAVQAAQDSYNETQNNRSNKHASDEAKLGTVDGIPTSLDYWPRT